MESIWRLDPDAVAPGNDWLKEFFGENYRANVVEQQLFDARGRSPEELDDDKAALLAALTECNWLVLMDTRIADAGLEHLKGLTKLERLDLERSLVTDSGVEALQQALPDLRIYH